MSNSKIECSIHSNSLSLSLSLSLSPSLSLSLSLSLQALTEALAEILENQRQLEEEFCQLKSGGGGGGGEKNDSSKQNMKGEIHGLTAAAQGNRETINISTTLYMYMYW